MGTAVTAICPDDLHRSGLLEGGARDDARPAGLQRHRLGCDGDRRAGGDERRARIGRCLHCRRDGDELGRDIALTALENATIRATADSAASASAQRLRHGHGAGVNATIATNVVLSVAQAYVVMPTSRPRWRHRSGCAEHCHGRCDVAERDDFRRHRSRDHARVQLDRWASQNVLFNAIDALLGTPLELRIRVGERAHRRQRGLRGGDLVLTAQSAAQIHAAVGNEAASAASALFGATGMSASGILASNKVSSRAEAYIDYTTTPDDHGGRGVSIAARDVAGIDATSTLLSSSTTSNDGGRASSTTSRPRCSTTTTTRPAPACGISSSATGCARMTPTRSARGGHGLRIHGHVSVGGGSESRHSGLQRFRLLEEAHPSNIIPSG